MQRFILNYLNKIGITAKPTLDRVDSHFEVAKLLCPEEIKQAFISEYINQDESRTYESLWFFSNNYCLEADNFLKEDKIDIVHIDRVYRVQMFLNNYNFKKSTIDSRIHLTIQFQEDNYGDLRASGRNCDFLKEINTKYFRSKLSKRTPTRSPLF